MIALVALGALELGFQWAEGADFIPHALGDKEYAASRLSAERLGVADVVVIGSSRAREGISAPLLAEAMAAGTGRRLKVANYSSAGGTAEEVHAQLAFLLSLRPDPAVVVYGISPRQLWGEGLKFEQASPFWDLSRWGEEYEEHGPAMLAQLPKVLRSGLERHWDTLAFRHRARSWLDQKLLGATRYPTAVEGGQTEWHARGPDLSMIGGRVKDGRVKWYVKRLLRKGQYPFDPKKLEELRRSMRLCRKAGVALVLVEMPLAHILHKHLPPGTYASFERQITQLAQQEQVRLVRLSDLGIALPTHTFLDQSHLNLRGASLLTQALARQVLVPLLAGSSGSAPP